MDEKRQESRSSTLIGAGVVAFFGGGQAASADGFFLHGVGGYVVAALGLCLVVVGVANRPRA